MPDLESQVKNETRPKGMLRDMEMEMWKPWLVKFKSLRSWSGRVLCDRIQHVA